MSDPSFCLPPALPCFQPHISGFRNQRDRNALILENAIIPTSRRESSSWRNAQEWMCVCRLRTRSCVQRFSPCTALGNDLSVQPAHARALDFQHQGFAPRVHQVLLPRGGSHTEQARTRYLCTFEARGFKLQPTIMIKDRVSKRI